MIDLKRAVSTYFNKRKVLLRTLSKKNIKKRDDFAELYVLMLFAEQSHHAQPANVQHAVYFVATSPSPHWNGASYFILVGPTGRKYAARSGLEVHAADGGTVELDVLVVDISPHMNNAVNSTSVVTAAETKLHRRKLSASAANEVIGKAVRVFGFPAHKHSTKVTRYCLVSANGISHNAAKGLTSANISTCGFGADLKRHVAATLATLRLS
jgi:hypothetical protein